MRTLTASWLLWTSERPVSPTAWNLIAPACLISSTAWAPRILARSSTEDFVRGGGIGPDSCEIQDAIRAPYGLNAADRSAGGVSVKNGWA
jgi:hypothetical protein